MKSRKKRKEKTKKNNGLAKTDLSTALKHFLQYTREMLAKLPQNLDQPCDCSPPSTHPVNTRHIYALFNIGLCKSVRTSSSPKMLTKLHSI